MTVFRIFFSLLLFQVSNTTIMLYNKKKLQNLSGIIWSAFIVHMSQVRRSSLCLLAGQLVCSLGCAHWLSIGLNHTQLSWLGISGLLRVSVTFQEATWGVSSWRWQRHKEKQGLLSHKLGTRALALLFYWPKPIGTWSSPETGRGHFTAPWQWVDARRTKDQGHVCHPSTVSPHPTHQQDLSGPPEKYFSHLSNFLSLTPTTTSGQYDLSTLASWLFCLCISCSLFLRLFSKQQSEESF